MSLDATRAVFARTDLPPYERLVMLALADRADDEMTCFPSIADICQRTGMGERGVQKVLNRLEETGFLIIRRGGGKHVRNGYLLLVKADNPAHDAPYQGDKPRTECAVSGPEDSDTPHHVPDTPHPVTSYPAPGAHEPSLTIIEPREEPPCIPQAAKTAEGKPEPKARLPANWALSDEGWAYARSKQIPDEDIRDEAAGFHAYWTDRGEKKSQRGWEHCWQTRVRAIAGRYAARRGVAFQAGTSRHGQGGSLASIVARRRAEGAV